MPDDPPEATALNDSEPRPAAGLRDVGRVRRVRSRRGATRAATLSERIRGPWRVVVEERSMAPAILPGDWLLVDPTIARWPRRGTIVVFREPDSGVLAVKRVAAGPGDQVQLDAGHLVLRADEAWLLSDAPLAALVDEGSGAPIDSRRYGPVTIDGLVGRAWFRYGPIRRIGRPAARQGDG